MSTLFDYEIALFLCMLMIFLFFCCISLLHQFFSKLLGPHTMIRRRYPDINLGVTKTTVSALHSRSFRPHLEIFQGIEQPIVAWEDDNQYA
jgi:hypothetical protein